MVVAGLGVVSLPKDTAFDATLAVLGRMKANLRNTNRATHTISGRFETTFTRAGHDFEIFVSDFLSNSVVVVSNVSRFSVDLLFIEGFYKEFAKTYTLLQRLPSVKASRLDEIRYHVKQAELDAIRTKNKAKPSLPKEFRAPTSSQSMPPTSSTTTLRVATSSNSNQSNSSSASSNGVLCPTCGHQNVKSAIFCNSCGAKILSSSVCVKCKNTNPEGSAFCNKCGNPLAGINYRGDRVPAYNQMQYKQDLRSACGNCGHSLGSHTRYGSSSSGSSKGTLPKGMSNKSTACNQCSCKVYKDKSKGGAASSPILTHQSFFFYSQTPAYYVEEHAASESGNHDTSSSHDDQQQDNTTEGNDNSGDIGGDFEF
jgi:hypothetical protein